jgi:hypothetical protein
MDFKGSQAPLPRIVHKNMWRAHRHFSRDGRALEIYQISMMGLKTCVECLPSKYKILNSNCSITKKKKRLVIAQALESNRFQRKILNSSWLNQLTCRFLIFQLRH